MVDNMEIHISICSPWQHSITSHLTEVTEVLWSTQWVSLGE
uniref:Uncharacterized protein n=1 Tax=Anguilla anguilla TaxID=7936 RepID=A0A0E9W359_ANGAN